MTGPPQIERAYKIDNTRVSESSWITIDEFMNNLEFSQLFGAIAPSTTSTDVIRILGRPDEELEKLLGSNSGWGTSNPLHIKIKPGDPVLQWVYYGETKGFCIWFAFQVGKWLSTLKLQLPLELIRRTS